MLDLMYIHQVTRDNIPIVFFFYANFVPCLLDVCYSTLSPKNWIMTDIMRVLTININDKLQIS